MGVLQSGAVGNVQAIVLALRGEPMLRWDRRRKDRGVRWDREVRRGSRPVHAKGEESSSAFRARASKESNV